MQQSLYSSHVVHPCCLDPSGTCWQCWPFLAIIMAKTLRQRFGQAHTTYHGGRAQRSWVVDFEPLRSIGIRDCLAGALLKTAVAGIAQTCASLRSHHQAHGSHSENANKSTTNKSKKDIRRHIMQACSMADSCAFSKDPLLVAVVLMTCRVLAAQAWAPGRCHSRPRPHHHRPPPPTAWSTHEPQQQRHTSSRGVHKPLLQGRSGCQWHCGCCM